MHSNTEPVEPVAPFIIFTVHLLFYYAFIIFPEHIGMEYCACFTAHF
jgi:hypothetical protein